MTWIREFVTKNALRVNAITTVFKIENTHLVYGLACCLFQIWFAGNSKILVYKWPDAKFNGTFKSIVPLLLRQRRK